MGFIVKAPGRWPGGKIHYSWEGVLPLDVKKDAVAVMARWEYLVAREAGKPLIQFVYNKNTTPRVGFRCVGSGYSAAGSTGILNGAIGNYIGVSNSTLQTDLENWPHEFGHIIGLGHEHMRPDTLLRAKPNNFIAETQLQLDRAKFDPHGDYDYQSIMHYKGGIIAVNFDIPTEWAQKLINDKRTAEEVKNATWSLSSGDLKAVVAMYK